MFNQLLETANATFFEKYGLIIILVVLLFAYFIWQYIRGRQYTNVRQDLITNLKIGTKIKTYSGIYGTVVGFYDVVENNTQNRVVLIALDGSKNIMEIDCESIYCIDTKITLEEYKAKLEAEQKQQSEAAEQPAEEKVEEVKEEPAEVVEVGEAPVKKTRSKKSNKKD